MSAVPTQSSGPSLSIIVPTYREAENLPDLIERIDAVRVEHGLDLEVIIVDDDSQDGAEDVVRKLNRPWVRILVRKENRGLSAAVLDGFRLARNEVLVVMDADLSHPPERIPAMLDALESGCDFAIGSRYVSGGTTDEDWGVLRWANSRIATLLARPFTNVKDPMSGFFMLRRTKFEQAAPLNPIGYKIGLELLVRCRCRRVGEIPIHFSKRRLGHSKLSVREQMRYLRHIRRLFIYRYENLAYFAQFAAVGFSGTFVNLAVLTVALWLGASIHVAVAAAILVALVSNFVLNRQFTFSYARAGSWWRQFAGFSAASSLGAIANYATTLLTLALWPALNRVPQVASLIGIAAGLVFNYFATRYFVFKKSS